MSAEIQAFDDPDGTIYRLRRDGYPDTFADWPHPLYALAPDAVRLPSVGTGMEASAGSAIMVGVNPELLHEAPTVRESNWMPHATLTGEAADFYSEGEHITILPGWTAFDREPRKRPWTERLRRMLDERIPGR